MVRLETFIKWKGVCRSASISGGLGAGMRCDSLRRREVGPQGEQPPPGAERAPLLLSIRDVMRGAPSSKSPGEGGKAPA